MKIDFNFMGLIFWLLAIIVIVFFIISIVLYLKSKKIQTNKDVQKENYLKLINNQIKNTTKIRQQQQEKLAKVQQEIGNQENKLLKLKGKITQQQEAIQQNNATLISFQRKIAQAESASETEIAQIHLDLQNIRCSAQEEKEKTQKQINSLKASLSAALQARQREQQKQNKIKFYKLSLSDEDLADIKKLEALKATFKKPVVLSKLIWTQYFQKQMSALCDRVLGKKTITGIYKITDLITKQSYIGQSVNVAQRFKQHCKCGLGIQASTTNSLYKAMQKDGVWNFTFELLEACPKEQLNQKEAFWIEFYSSNIYGLNSNSGIATKGV